MIITLSELNPFIENIEINGVLLETTAFNLRAETWAEKHFESLEKFIGKIKAGDPTAIYLGFYTVLKNKTFGYKHFLKEILFKDKKMIGENTGAIANHLAEIITYAQPLIKNPEAMLELREVLGKNEDAEEENYALLFDKIARRYGYSIETYYELTSRQIHAIFKAADIEDYKILEQKAALHGRKLKERIKFHDFTPEESKAHEEQAFAAIDRITKRAEKENG